MYRIAGTTYSSQTKAWLALKQLLLNTEPGTVIGPCHPVFPTLLQHPRAQAKLYKPGGKLRRVVVSRKGALIIDGCEDFSAKKCVMKLKSWPEFGEPARLRNACRTAIRTWIDDWKRAQAATTCWHCSCRLGPDWQADHLDTKFAAIANEWLASRGAAPETEPNPGNSLMTDYHYRFREAAVAAEFVAFHESRVGTREGIVAACAECNRERR